MHHYNFIMLTTAQLILQISCITWLFQGYNIHVNGIFHCTVRYKQLYSLYEQIKKEFGSIAAQLPTFPAKKILPLSGTQLEERRQFLEKYIQAGLYFDWTVQRSALKCEFFFFIVGQDRVLSNCELFNGFLLTAQQETRGPVENVVLEVFLMNGHKISLNVNSNERSDHILEVGHVLTIELAELVMVNEFGWIIVTESMRKNQFARGVHVLLFLILDKEGSRWGHYHSPKTARL